MANVKKYRIATETLKVARERAEHRAKATTKGTNEVEVAPKKAVEEAS